MTGSPQHMLHLPRPVFFLDFDQCLKFAQIVRIAQRVQNAFQRMVPLPMIVDDDAQNLFQQAAPFRRGPVERQPDGRGDVEPLRLTADPEAVDPLRGSTIHLLDRCHRHTIAHGDGEALEAGDAASAHGGVGGGYQMHTEQIGHQHRQPLLGQQLKMQQIHHDRRGASGILHRRSHIREEVRARLGTAMTAMTGKCTVFRDNQGLWVGKVEDLPRGMARGRCSAQGTAASGTGLGKMIDGGIGVFRPAQRLVGVAVLSARLFARTFAQTAGAGGLLFPIVAGGRLAAIATVQAELTLQFGDPCL